MKKYREHRRTLKDGTTAVYRYSRDGRRLRADPATMQFKRELTGDVPRAVSAVIREYASSPEYHRLAPSTKKTYGYYFDLLDQFGDAPISQIRRADIRAIKDGVESSRGPGAANCFLTAARVVFRFALRYDYIESNPCQNIDPSPLGEYARWPDAVVDRFLESCKSPAVLTGAMLAIHTGQRRSDILTMRWSHLSMSGGVQWLAVKQKKTGAMVNIPLTAELAEFLATRPRTGEFMVSRPDGQAYTGNGFHSAVLLELARAELGNHRAGGFSFHGLRKTAAARLAEAGCSAHEIMSITGHQTLGMVQRYASGADQKVRALSAIRKLKK